MSLINFFAGDSLIWFSVRTIFEILILWLVFYRILVFFEGTRAFQVLKGIIYIVLAFLISQVLQLNTLNWLLTKFFAISIIAFLIIFQQELRQGLARLGQQHLFGVALAEQEIVALVEEITSAVYKLSSRKIGCIIAIERETRLKAYLESGVAIDSKVISELLQSIFIPTSPLHDGGVIIRGERILAAACLFPLSENPSFSKIIGTRHRAALGLTEQTDAVVVMVSEETTEVSIAEDGRFIPIVNKERFTNILKSLLLKYSERK
ncbi:MAG: diadenylate cyclase CdaA [Candidatus Omnitrophota bacterium]